MHIRGGNNIYESTYLNESIILYNYLYYVCHINLKINIYMQSA